MTLFYIVMLLIILLVDIRERRILNIIAIPGTAAALLVGLAAGYDEFLAAFLGSIVGFLFFYVLYTFGSRLYGPAALGFGDVKLAMLLGAILGVQHVLPVLSFGMLLAGLAAVVALLLRRENRGNTLPYGAFLAIAGIVALVWTGS